MKHKDRSTTKCNACQGLGHVGFSTCHWCYGLGRIIVWSPKAALRDAKRTGKKP